jgi:hypothetical protein
VKKTASQRRPKRPLGKRAKASAEPRDRRARPRYTSATAVAAEALRTGIVPAVRRHGREEPEIPREDETIRVGDPDDRSLANEYVGEDTPGGTSPTPDQNSVDDIGRAYGLQEEDAGPLRTASEVLNRRDKHRPELTPPRRRRV